MVLNFFQRPKTSESLEKFKLSHNTGLNLIHNPIPPQPPHEFLIIKRAIEKIVSGLASTMPLTVVGRPLVKTRGT